MHPGMTTTQKCQQLANVVTQSCAGAGYAVTVSDCAIDAFFTASHVDCPGTEFALGISNSAGTFDQTTVAGSYGFEAVLDWDMERTGHVHRVERLEAFVKVKPDRANTEVKLTRPAAGTVQITVTPRDKFGNYLGPGYASLVKAQLTSTGRITGPTDPDQIGTYVFTIVGVPSGETPDVDITVDGVLVFGNPRKG